MRFALVLMSFVASLAQASVYTCKVQEQGKTVTIRFAVEESASGKMKMGDLPGGEEHAPIRVTPSRLPNGMAPLAESLNENWTFQVNKKEMVISGDADGFYSIKLVLYRNSDFTKGYMSVKGDENLYSVANCTVK